MYGSSGSQFFRTTNGIQSRSDAFDESRFIKTFLTIFGVTEMLCSFRLVLEGKLGEGIPQSSRFRAEKIRDTLMLCNHHTPKVELRTTKQHVPKIYISSYLHLHYKFRSSIVTDKS